MRASNAVLEPAALWDKARLVHPLAVVGCHRVPEPAQGIAAVLLINARRGIVIDLAGNLFFLCSRLIGTRAPTLSLSLSCGAENPKSV